MGRKFKGKVVRIVEKECPKEQFQAEDLSSESQNLRCSSMKMPQTSIFPFVIITLLSSSHNQIPSFLSSFIFTLTQSKSLRIVIILPKIILQMKSTPLFPKNQYNIPRGLIKKCQLCSQQFGVFVRQHLCKRCHRTICSNCGHQQRQVFKVGYQKRLHRVCLVCKEGSEYTIKYIKLKNLAFNSMSMVAINWLSKMKKPQLNQHNKPISSVLKIDHVRSLWDSYSFQFRQFVGLLTYEYEHKSIFEVINNVYSKVTAIEPVLKTQQVIYLIIFFLCFASVDNAVMLTLGFIELKNKILNEKQTIYRCLRQFPFQGEIAQLERYINYRIGKHYNSYMVNANSMECMIAMVNKVFENGNYEEVIYCFTSHLFTCRKFITINSNNYQLCDIQMLRNCKKQEIWSNFQYLRKKKLIFEKQEQHMRTKSELVMPDIFTSKSREERFSENIEDNNNVISMKKRQLSNHSGSLNQQSFSEIGSLSMRSHNEIPHFSKETQELRKQTVSQLQSELESKNTQITEIKNQNKSNKSGDSSLHNKITVLEASLKASQLKNDTDKLQILKLKQKIKQHQEFPKQILKERDQLKQSNQKMRQQLQKLKIEISLKEQRIEQLLKQNKVLEGVRNDNEILADQTKKIKEIIEQQQKQINQLDTKVLQQEQIIKKQTQKNDDLKDIIASMEVAGNGKQNEYLLIIKENSQIKDEVKKLQQKIEELYELNQLKQTPLYNAELQLQKLRMENKEMKSRIQGYEQERVNSINKKEKFSVKQGQSLNLQLTNPLKSSLSQNKTVSERINLQNPIKGKMALESVYSQNHTHQSPKKETVKTVRIYELQSIRIQPAVSGKTQQIQDNLSKIIQQKEETILKLQQELSEITEMLASKSFSYTESNPLNPEPNLYSTLPANQLKQRINDMQSYSQKLQSQVQSLTKKNQQFVSKFGQISSLALKFQEQKMNLAEEVFELRQILRQHNIQIDP